jgi:hypothetical protein
MPNYTVKKYEDLYEIVFRECGTTDVSEVLSHPNNKMLFSTRSEYILKDGDKLWLPSRKKGLEIVLDPTKCYALRSGLSRPFTLKIEKRNGEPIANTSYKLIAGNQEMTGTTDGNGVVRQRVPFRAKRGRLELGNQVIECRFSGLDPLHTVTGIQCRLANLGYYFGKIDGIIGNGSKRAIKSFQRNNDLKSDGIVGKKTRKKLLERHGC